MDMAYLGEDVDIVSTGYGVWWTFWELLSKTFIYHKTLGGICVLFTFIYLPIGESRGEGEWKILRLNKPVIYVDFFCVCRRL